MCTDGISDHIDDIVLDAVTLLDLIAHKPGVLNAITVTYKEYLVLILKGSHMLAHVVDKFKQ